MIEATEAQDLKQFENVSRRVFALFLEEYGQYSQISPSLHRAIQHGLEFMTDYQSDGLTIGMLSETAQEAINAPTKADVSRFSFRGSHSAQNLGCFKRSWMFTDPHALEFE